MPTNLAIILKMKTQEAHTSLKQGLYKLYLFKSLKDGVELKDIKEKINTHIKDESIGAGYRNLVRDYIKDELVKVENKTYSLTDKGLECFEELSQNLLEYTKDFNDVPPPTLTIDDHVIEKFNFRDYPLEIKKFYSINESLNTKLIHEFEQTTKEYQKDTLEALVFSDYPKLNRIKSYFQGLYLERIEKYLTQEAINYYQNQKKVSLTRTTFSLIWVLRILAVFMIGNIFGNQIAFLTLKTMFLAYLTYKFMQRMLTTTPYIHKFTSYLSAFTALIVPTCVYLLNAKSQFGVNLFHIRILDTLLITAISLYAISFYFKHMNLKGLDHIKKFFIKLTPYKWPMSIFATGALLLFFHITYDLLTIQLASIASAIVIIPMILGLDLFEQFENIQGANTDIRNKGLTSFDKKNLANSNLN